MINIPLEIAKDTSQLSLFAIRISSLKTKLIPMKPNKLKSIVSLFTVISFIPMASAATISLLGIDSTTGADWRTTTTLKSASFDPNGDNAYGSGGYYMAGRPTAAADTSTPTVLSTLPSFITSVTTTGLFFSAGTYYTFDDPTLAIGATVGNVRGGLYYGTGTKFTFTVSTPQDFVLAVLVGGGPSNPRPTSVTVASGAATATALPLVNAAQYALFNISAAAGETFDVSMIGAGNTGLTGLGFEAIPEPSSAVLGALGALALLRRRRA